MKKSTPPCRRIPVKLSKVEELILSTWINSLPKRYLKKDVLFKFDGSNGIGIAIIAVCGNRECNITDYSMW